MSLFFARLFNVDEEGNRIGKKEKERKLKLGIEEM